LYFGAVVSVVLRQGAPGCELDREDCDPVLVQASEVGFDHHAELRGCVANRCRLSAEYFQGTSYPASLNRSASMCPDCSPQIVWPCWRCTTQSSAPIARIQPTQPLLA